MAKSRSQSARYQKMAQEYLDLMQRQMAGTLTHPDFIRSMLELTAHMSRADAPARHTPDAPEPGADAISRLERRVAKLERQLAGLSAQLTDANLGRRSGTRGTKRPTRATPDAARTNAKKPPKTSAPKRKR